MSSKLSECDHDECPATHCRRGPKGKAAITAQDFESACEGQIGGNLWDETFSLGYQEPISLTIAEMRHLANLLRAAEGRKSGWLTVESED